MFYIYIHYKLTDNKPFYVGKGKGNRMNVRRQRSKEWQQIVSNYGFSVKYFAFLINEKDAFECEKEVILNLKNSGEILCNKTTGGQGASGTIISQENKNRISQSLKKYFSNKDARLISSVSAKNRMQKSEERENVSQGLKRFYKNNPQISLINSIKAKERILNNEEQLNNLRNLAELQKKKVFCVQNKKRFDSVTDAKNWLIEIGYLKAQTGAISLCCKGVKNKYLNFNWQYI